MIAMLCGAGCEAMQRPEPADRGLELREVSDADGLLRAEDALPERPSMREYRITAGPAKSSSILQSVERTTNHGAQWAFNDDGTRVEYWGIDDAGNLVLPVVIDYADRTISVFDPPLVLVYERMSRGEQRREEVDMRVLDQRNPDRIVQRGTAKRTVEYVGQQTVRTPMGEHRAHRLAVTFEATMPMAEIYRTSTLFMVPGIGLVAEESKERIQIRDLIDRDQKQTIVLARIQVAGEEQQ